MNLIITAAAFVILLVGATFLMLRKLGPKTRIISLLFIIALLIHLGAVLFVYYTDFQPFSGGKGDYAEYDAYAKEVAERVRQGDFSLEGMETSLYYPVIIGYIYAFTISDMLVGQILNAWLIALLAVFACLIVIEIGRSEKDGFLVGLIVSAYPSLLFYGSLLLKDAFVALLSFVALLFILRLIKKFSLSKFLIFYIALGFLINFRIYVGYAVLFTFLICWFLFSGFNFKKRIKYLIVIIPLLGFLPQFFAGQGYFGASFLKTYLNRETITYYRETVYAPIAQPSQVPPIVVEPDVSEPAKPQPSCVIEPQLPSVLGKDSSVTIKTGFESPFVFLKNTSLSFINSLLGPFPWQMKQSKHFFALLEVIPWYFLLFFIIKGIIKSVKEKYRVILPLVIFSFFVLGILALFIGNFGIITRIRIPAFASLLCLLPFGVNWTSSSKIGKFFSNKLDILIKL